MSGDGFVFPPNADPADPDSMELLAERSYYPASLAVDGRTDTRFFDGRSCAYASMPQRNSWWVLAARPALPAVRVGLCRHAGAQHWYYCASRAAQRCIAADGDGDSLHLAGGDVHWNG